MALRIFAALTLAAALACAAPLAQAHEGHHHPAKTKKVKKTKEQKKAGADVRFAVRPAAG